MNNPIEAAMMTQVKLAIKRGKRRNRQEGSYAPAPGMAEDRARPTHSGHCGAEKCNHASHKRFNEVAS